jgi:heme exporter protein B
MVWAHLIKKEMLSQLRSQSSIQSLILYVFSTTFIVFTAFFEITPKAWITLYWIILILSLSNTAQQSFFELKGIQAWYYYASTSVHHYFISKVVTVFILLVVISLCIVGGLSLFSSFVIKDVGLFILTNMLSIVGLSVIFTFISFIVVKVQGKSALLPLLAFPLLVPILSLCVRLSSISAGLIMDTQYEMDLLLLLGVDMIAIALSLLLIRYLWQS